MVDQNDSVNALSTLKATRPLDPGSPAWRSRCPKAHDVYRPAYSDALITAGVDASVGSVGDSCDDALAETANGLHKAGLIHRQRTWPSVTAVETATLDWVPWWNAKRLHEALGYRTPAEVEAIYTHHRTSAPATV